MLKLVFALSLVLVGIDWMLNRFSENVRLSLENKKPKKKGFIMPSSSNPNQPPPNYPEKRDF